MDDKLSPLLSAAQVAEILNIKKSTVYEAVARGRLCVVRLWRGKKRTFLRFRRSDIEEFIRQRSLPVGAKCKE